MERDGKIFRYDEEEMLKMIMFITKMMTNTMKITKDYSDKDLWNYMYGMYDYGNKSDSAIMELKCKLIELKKLINQ